MMEIRDALPGEVEAIATLMDRRREIYERHQPPFWRRAARSPQRARRLPGHAGEQS